LTGAPPSTATASLTAGSPYSSRKGGAEGGGGGGVAAGADVLRRLVEAALRGVQPARDRAAAAARVVVVAAAAAMKIWKLIGGCWLGLLQTKTMSTLTKKKIFCQISMKTNKQVVL
jgi:hypothetical protein